MARFPSYAPVDGLPWIGSERGLPQGVNETAVNYAARQNDAWNSWTRAGTPVSLLVALHYAGIDNAVLVQQNGVYYQLTLPLPPPPADPTGNLVVGALGALPSILTSSVTPGRSIPSGTPWWMFDSNTDFTSRFAIVFPLGSSALTAAQQSALKAVVKAWKPGKATYMGAVLITSGEAWGWPVGTWGDAGTWGPATETVYGP